METEYSDCLHMTYHDNIGINEFLSPFTTQMCRTFAMKPTQNPAFLAPIVGEGMKGTWETAG